MTQRAIFEAFTSSPTRRALELVPPRQRRSAAAREWRRYDRMLGALGLSAIDAAKLQVGERVLDVACGSGGMTLQAAHRVGSRGAVAGLDVDADAITVARTRAREQLLGWASFATADPEHVALPSGAFHAVVSRFGIPSFADPERGLERLSGALLPGGRLAFVAWRTPSENLWYSLPRQLLAEGFGQELSDRTDPFVFADRDAALRTLVTAGFSAITIDAVDSPLWIGDDVDDAIELFFETDGDPLDDRLDEKALAKLTHELRRTFGQYAGPEGVRLPSAAWIVSARRR